jgi:hypothetical protein
VVTRLRSLRRAGPQLRTPTHGCRPADTRRPAAGCHPCDRSHPSSCAPRSRRGRRTRRERVLGTSHERTTSLNERRRIWPRLRPQACGSLAAQERGRASTPVRRVHMEGDDRDGHPECTTTGPLADGSEPFPRPRRLPVPAQTSEAVNTRTDDQALALREPPEDDVWRWRRASLIRNSGPAYVSASSLRRR